MSNKAASGGIDGVGDRTRRVLVFPAGTEIGLEIYAALQWCRGIELVGAGDNSINHARFVFPSYHCLPRVECSDWIEALACLVREQRIDYIFPAHDEVIHALAVSSNLVRCPVIGSPPRTGMITRSKLATYAHLEGIVRVPKVFSEVETIGTYPVFVKPDQGQGAQGARMASDPGELATAVSAAGGTGAAVVCEYLPGEEFTVDCFSSRRDGLMFVGARQRRRVRNGIAVNSITVDLPEAEAMARAISSRIELHGAWFFQLRRDSVGNLVLLEVAPRIAGTMGLHRVTGVNLPLLSLLDLEGVRVEIAPNPGVVEVDRALRNRFRHSMRYSTLYIDLDDTLVFNGRVNPDLVALVFRAINSRKRVILITRHDGDLEGTLSQHRLSGLFDHIVHVPPGREKHEFIEGGLAVFVDDSFSERRKVALACGIPTLDASMAELLYNEAPSGGVESP